MPDRAVVDDDDFEPSDYPVFVPPHGTYPATFEVQRVFHGKPMHESDACEMCGCDECTLTWIPSDQLPARFVGSPGEWLCQRCDPTPQPRALCAVSEDRQWLS